MAGQSAATESAELLRLADVYIEKTYAFSMKDTGKRTFTRRAILKASVIAGSAVLVGFQDAKFSVLRKAAKDAFRGAKNLGLIEFTGEAPIPTNTLMGTDLDGRLLTDLSDVGPNHPTTTNRNFFVRTRASELLQVRKPWTIQVSGLVKHPSEMSLADVRKVTRPAGMHLMECSGNVRDGHFGLLSVGDWTGVLASQILGSLPIEKAASHVLISGFDDYPNTSATSEPGASWIFSMDAIQSSKAFFATGMNGSTLARDHGAPVRLVVPGWYGCTCIKWVDKIQLLDADAATTSQMREFAGRTMQRGVPERVKDYSAPIIEQAAMPVRVEKWLVGRKIKYLVNGIAWGGSQPVSDLAIRFNEGEDFVPVDDFDHSASHPWSFWAHAWTPIRRGGYVIQLRVKDTIPARRLNSGFFVRSVDITEI